MDLAAERTFVGALIGFGPAAQEALATKLTTDTITDPGVWFLARVIRMMHREGIPADQATIAGLHI